MRLLLPVTLLGFISSPAVALKALNVGRIVEGGSTTVQQYPFISNIQLLTNDQWWTQWCGGTLVSATTVLSAAHCYFDDSFTSLWRIRLGSSFASSGGTVHNVLQFIFHEGYNHTSLVHDLTLLRLSTAAWPTSNVGVAKLASPALNLEEESVVTAVGWGTLTLLGLKPEQLQHVDLRVVSHETCVDRYRTLQSEPGFEWWPYSVTEDMICAAALDEGGVCVGDSGGPVVYRTSDEVLVIGITSWGYACANAVYPGVSVKISHYYDWIMVNI